MRLSDLIRIAISLVLVTQVAVIPLAWADPPERSTAEVEQELKAMRKVLEELRKTLQEQSEIVQKQQARMEELERKVSAPAPAEVSRPSVAAPVPSPTKGATLPGQIGAILPEIGVVGDVVATSSERRADTEGNDRVALRAVELVLGSYVDPYSRFDARIEFSDSENPEVDVAYLTHWGLPWDLKGYFGRVRPVIGKASVLDQDSLDTVDEPLVVSRYFGKEGYFRTGVQLSRLGELPGGITTELTGGVAEGGVGEDGTAFGSTRRRPTLFSHLKLFKELSETSNLEWGFTHLTGSKDADARFEVNVFGTDLTYRHYVTPTNPLKLQGEFYLQDRDEAFSINSDTGVTTHFDRHPWGAYLLADYRLAPRWSVGARADHVRLVESQASRHADQGTSTYLTFHQSEWARWRLQYRHTEGAQEKTDDAVLLQGTFAIGSHKHQLQ